MRNPGTYIYSWRLSNGDLIHKGSYIITPKGIAEVTGILQRPNEGIFIHAQVFGEPRGDIFLLNEVKLATFSEYCFNDEGFGKTRWRDFFIMETILLFGLIVGIITWSSYGIGAIGAVLLVNLWFLIWTWFNFNGQGL